MLAESCGTEATMVFGYSPGDPIMRGKSWVSIDREGVAGEYREAGLCLPMLLSGRLEPHVVAGKHTAAGRLNCLHRRLLS